MVLLSWYFNQEVDAALCEKANKLGREFVIQVTGTVRERSSKNAHIPTGDIELIVSGIKCPEHCAYPSVHDRGGDRWR